MRLDRTFSVVGAAAFKGFVALAVVAFPFHVRAQARPTTVFGLEPGQTSAVDVGLNYAYVRANAPPAACGCFSMNGGGGNLVINMSHGLSLVADLQATHVNNINGTPQTITVFDYLLGPRYSYRTGSRFTPYVQVLVGGSEELSNYAFVQGSQAFAVSGGGGVSRLLSRHFAWNIVEVDYVYSRLPNAVNDHQNDLRVTTGLAFRFGPR
jgi:outer membrane immunogenic protein